MKTFLTLQFLRPKQIFRSWILLYGEHATRPRPTLNVNPIWPGLQAVSRRIAQMNLKTKMSWLGTPSSVRDGQLSFPSIILLIFILFLGLQTFEILHNAGCLSDPNLHTYCYLTAALSSNPFDLFVYSLPLGIHIPKSSTTSCSACSKSILSVYADALRAGTPGTGALKTTFYDGLTKCQSGCGADFSLVGAGLNPETNAARKVGYLPVRNALLSLGLWAVVFSFV